MPDERSRHTRTGPRHDSSSQPRRCAMATAAALCSIALGLGFGLPARIRHTAFRADRRGLDIHGFPDLRAGPSSD